MHGANIWLISDVVVDIASDKLLSKITTDPVMHDAAVDRSGTVPLRRRQLPCYYCRALLMVCVWTLDGAVVQLVSLADGRSIQSTAASFGGGEDDVNGFTEEKLVVAGAVSLSPLKRGQYRWKLNSFRFLQSAAECVVLALERRRP